MLEKSFVLISFRLNDEPHVRHFMRLSYDEWSEIKTFPQRISQVNALCSVEDWCDPHVPCDRLCICQKLNLIYFEVLRDPLHPLEEKLLTDLGFKFSSNTLKEITTRLLNAEEIYPAQYAKNKSNNILHELEKQIPKDLAIMVLCYLV
jgi:hypothetical protein